MTGTIRKISKCGVGIIDGMDGSRVPFILSQGGNQHDLRCGQNVIFSVRMVNNIAFAQNVMAFGRVNGER
jgi:hypothetical protein